MTAADRDQIRAAVAARYAGLARAVQAGQAVTDGDPGAENVEFLRGRIEAIPLPDRSVDVIISDILAGDHLTPAQQRERGAKAGCIAGAPSFTEYRDGLTLAGFTGIVITPAHQVGDGAHSAIIRAVRP
jgi:hypothetical protein